MHARTEIRSHSGRNEPVVPTRPITSRRASRGPRPGSEDQTQDYPRGCTQPAAHPAALSQIGRCLPALRSGRECNGRSPPTPSRAWRPRAPDEGRCRADPHCTHDGGGRHFFLSFFSPCSVVPRRSARNADVAAPGAGDPPCHRQPNRRRGPHGTDVVLEDKQAKLLAYDEAVEKHTVEAYLNEVADRQAQPQNTIPTAWLPQQLRGGWPPRAYAGYCGIREWNGSTDPAAGSTPASVQLAREAAHGQGPADAPGDATATDRPGTTRYDPARALSDRPTATPLRTWPSPAPCRSSPAMR